MIDDTTQLRRPRATTIHTGITAPTARPATTWLLAAVAVVLVLIGGVVLHHSAFDLPVVRAMNSLHTGALGVVTNAVYLVISPAEAIVLTAVATLAIWLARRDVRPAAAFAVVIAGTWVPSAIVKVVAHRPRPEASLLPHPYVPAQVDASYPSGHAVFAVAVAVAVVFLFQGTRHARTAAVIAPIGALVVLLSLLVDGVHFPTDVLASVVWALGVAPLVRMVWVSWIAPRVPVLR